MPIYTSSSTYNYYFLGSAGGTVSYIFPLWLAGYNTNGELGQSNTSSSNVFTKVGLLSWSQVSMGVTNTLAIRNDGTLWAWGDNFAGGLGDGTTINKSSPVQVAGSWINAVAGNGQSYGIKSDKTLWAWGQGNKYQLGNNLTTNRSNPVQIAGSWNSITAHSEGAFGVRATDGYLYSWGGNTYGQLGLSDTVTRSSPVQVGANSPIPGVWTYMTAGVRNTTVYYGTTFGIASDGSLWGWGYHIWGTIGDGTTVDKSSPVKIGNSSWTMVNNVQALTTYAIRSDGTLWSWGYGAHGQLGIGSATARSSPVQVAGSWSAVSGGWNTSGYVLAINSAKQLFAWGDNVTQLGLGSGISVARSSPVQVTSPASSWTMVNAGYNTAHAITTLGKLFGWGQNNTGQIGDNTTVIKSVPTAIGTSSWITVSSAPNGNTGDDYNHAIRIDGTLWGWGTSGNYLGGSLSSITRSSPTQIGTNTNWSSVIATYRGGRGITTSGQLYVWGQNSSYELGLGDTVNRSSATQVSGTTSWSMVAGGMDKTFALTNTGHIWFSGAYSYGELGDGISNGGQYLTLGPGTLDPTVGALVKWKQISGTWNHFVGLALSDNSLWAWGSNSNGQLGDGTAITRSSPTQMTALGPFQSVAAGGQNTAAIKYDGSLWTWGGNVDGQLGDSTTIDKSSPVQVTGGGTWSSVSVGMSNFMAGIQTTNTVYTWGLNGSGQLGDGDAISRSAPIQIGNSATAVSAGYRDIAIIGADNYSNQLTFIVSQTIVAFSPISGTTGISGLTYSISPSLPAGLSLNTGTGYISGTPTTATPTAVYTLTATSMSQTLSATFIATVTIVGAAIITYGTTSWTCPAGVYSVSVVCIGGGAGGGVKLGGGGGGLGYKNNYTVVPGTVYTVSVAGYTLGSNGGSTPGPDTYFINATTVKGGGGQRTGSNIAGAGGTYVGDGGGNGGAGGYSIAGNFSGGGGGGAGGYTGTGGRGGSDSTSSSPTAGVGGGGGGGGSNYGTGAYFGAGGGGGVDLYGLGSNGAAGVSITSNLNNTTGLVMTGGGGGSGGANGSDGASGNASQSSGGNGGITYGGGGGGAGGSTSAIGYGAQGAIRIMWPGTARSFPSTMASNLTSIAPILSVAVSSSSLPINISANVTPITVANGVSPYVYSVSPSLPTGLSMNTTSGAITGTPTSLSSSTSYTVSVYDSNYTPATATASFTIAVV
jgi:alpha-tubulin suppressor-like RCC1 family protein